MDQLSEVSDTLINYFSFCIVSSYITISRRVTIATTACGGVGILDDIADAAAK